MDERIISGLSSIEDLQKLGAVEELRQDLEKIVAPLAVMASSYEDLWAIVETLKTCWAPCIKGAFVSRKKELLYALNMLDGAKRNQTIGITADHYGDKAKAKLLYRSLRQQIADKTGVDPDAEAAFKTLTEIFYNVMDVPEGHDLEGDDGDF